MGYPLSGVIICGTPQDSDGYYRCPYCGFRSLNIDHFAIGMCWDCVFKEDNKEEENMAVEGVKNSLDVKLDELKPGDVVKFHYTDEVSNVNEVTGHARTKKGARIRMTNGKGWEAVGSDSIKFTAELVSRKPKEPVFWPPQPGDVWRDNFGNEYLVLGQPGNGVKIYTPTDAIVTLKELQGKLGIRKVYRKGQ